jgi:exonuclease SbcD
MVVFTFLHAADIHLDSPLRGLFRYEGAPDVDEIRGATRHALDNLVGFVLSEKVPLVIIAGDLYDGDWQDFNTPLYFAKQMQRLGEAGVRVAVVRGNHDAANTMTKTLIMPDNVKIFRARKPETWRLEELGVAVHGQSYATQDVTENLAVGYPDPIPGMLNIGVLHCLISGSQGHLPYAPCTLDELAAKGYDYWALGHVHEYAVLRQQPLIVYSGCSQGRHIKETGQKGCVLVEAENGTLKTEFVPLDVFRWVKVTADIGGAETIGQVATLFGEVLEEAMAKQDGRPCCVRVILQGRCPIHGRLSTDPETLSANIRAVATDVSRGRAWVEKVELDTAPDFDVEALAQSDTPQGELLRYLEELASSSQLYQDLGVDLTQLKSKLSGNHVAVPEGNMDRMLVGARDILLAMLADIESKEKS